MDVKEPRPPTFHKFSAAELAEQKKRRAAQIREVAIKAAIDVLHSLPEEERHNLLRANFCSTCSTDIRKNKCFCAPQYDE